MDVRALPDASPRPSVGEQVAWGESSAIVFANSVLGARTERYPDLLDICCAVTGRAPAAGLHLPENRAGEVLVDLTGVPERLAAEPALYPVLGHWVGLCVRGRIPVFDGLSARPAEDDLKALGAAMASSGAVALFHWVGLTPEAPDRMAAFHEREPAERLRPGPTELRAARDELGSGLSDAEGLDLVVLGSPHFSLAEFAALARLVEGRRRHPGVRLLITTGRAVRALAGEAGYVGAIEAFGGELTVDTCILTTPMLPAGIQRLMTNSAKYAWYTPSLLERAVCLRKPDGLRGFRRRRPRHARRKRVDRRAVSGKPAVPGSGPLIGRALVPGAAEGTVLYSSEPLSFWGGYDAETGEIIDRRHPLFGQIGTRRILAIPATRGSSTTTAVLLEAIRRGTAPAAFLTPRARHLPRACRHSRRSTLRPRPAGHRAIPRGLRHPARDLRSPRRCDGRGQAFPGRGSAPVVDVSYIPHLGDVGVQGASLLSASEPPLCGVNPSRRRLV